MLATRTVEPKTPFLIYHPLIRLTDPLGIQGRRVLNHTATSDMLSEAENSFGLIPGMEVWQRPLQGGEYAVAAVSKRTDGRPQHMHFTLADAGLKADVGSYLCVDLFGTAS